MLGDPDFYSQCTAFLFLKDQGLAAAKRYREMVSKKDDECCTEVNEEAVIGPPIAAFMRVMQELHQIPGALLPVRKYIEGKLSAQPEVILLRYRSQQKIRELTF